MAEKTKKEDDEDETGEQPEFVTKAQLSDLVNKAVSAHVTRAVKGLKLEETIAGAITAAVAPLAERFGQQGQAGTVTPPANQGQISPELKSLQDQVRQASEILSQERKARQEAEDKQKRLEERQSLQTALKKNKIADSLMPAAMALLAGEENRVTRDKETGAIMFRAPADFGDEVMPLEKGVAAWAATDAAKAFKAPSGAQGGPSGKGVRPGAQGGKQQMGKDGKPKPYTWNQLGNELNALFGQMSQNPNGVQLGQQPIMQEQVAADPNAGNLYGGVEED